MEQNRPAVPEFFVYQIGVDYVPAIWNSCGAARYRSAGAVFCRYCG